MEMALLDDIFGQTLGFSMLRPEGMAAIFWARLCEGRPFETLCVFSLLVTEVPMPETWVQGGPFGLSHGLSLPCPGG